MSHSKTFPIDKEVGISVSLCGKLLSISQINMKTGRPFPCMTGTDMIYDSQIAKKVDNFLEVISPQENRKEIRNYVTEIAGI